MTSWLAAAFRQALKKFRESNSGNVALIFAITLVPLLAATGTVVDYTRAVMARSEMQDALDATALFLSTNTSTPTMSQTALNTAALKYFSANFTNTDVSGTLIAATYTATGGLTVTVGGSATVKTDFMGIVGIPTMPIAAQSVAVWGHQRLRVALVLDNTGSMSSSGKIAALKTATHNLLTQLQGAASVNGDVYVSIVPFVKDVNAGAGNYAATWVQFDDGSTTTNNSWDAANGSCSISGNSPRSTCLAAGNTCSISSKTTQSTCGTCSVSAQTTQVTCVAVSACSIASRTTQATCIATGVCSVASRTTQATCIATGICSIASRTTQATCIATGTCSITSKTTSGTCTAASGCFISGTYTATWTTSGTCASHSGSWNRGTWTAQTAGTWTPQTAGTWTTQTAGVWGPATWTAGVWTPQGVWTHSNHNTWNGCVTDRGSSWTTGPGTSAGYDQTIDAPDTSNAATLFPAEQFSPCPQAVAGLTYDWTSLGTLVDNMAAGGSTNQPIGLAWGWLSLVGGGPFAVPAFDPTYQYKQVIILLSDGLNTKDRWYGDGSNTSTDVDGRMYYQNGGGTVSGTCKNAKDSGIIMYTVQVNTGGDPLSTLLQNCASDPSQFFELTTASQIITTFQAIGTALSDLRLSS